jgi:Na+/H+-translocating membrane pyrophosphatase
VRDSSNIFEEAVALQQQALEPAAVAAFNLPSGQPRVVLRISAGGRVLAADVAAKSIRKVQATITETEPENVTIIVQGKLEADKLSEAGIVAQIKTPKPAIDTA